MIEISKSSNPDSYKPLKVLVDFISIATGESGHEGLELEGLKIGLNNRVRWVKTVFPHM